jgi:hypothetical protein
MSDLTALLVDPPVPGSIVWRGWLTKKGSFMPTLKRRFCTLQIGQDYAVTLDYREDATSSTSKGCFTFTVATKCLETSSSVGSFPPQQSLIIQIDPSSGAKVLCGFDAVETRQLFQAAVDWAVNAKSHVACFQAKQEQAKKIAEAEDMKRVQVQLQRARQESGHQPGDVQQDLSLQQKSATRPRQNSGVDDREFATRLVLEISEHHKILHGVIVRSQHSSTRSHDSSSAVVGSMSTSEFVKGITLEQKSHSMLLALAAQSAARCPT